ncbi:MAG TPA: ShlB/FhaC/HecB family hemolysin secretion/activation protein [Burkholderiales bacterium]|nr:ShlB/FhaC/HecB family hemolysin secretion/activation protein [Burkholderiales bacterium]
MGRTSTLGMLGLLAGAICVLLFEVNAAVAQTAPRAQRPQPRPQQPLPPKPQPQPQAQQQPPQPQVQTAPSQPPAPVKFEIRRYLVEGNTLLSLSDLEKTLKPFVGKERDFGDIQRALEALQDVYAARGYNAVRVSVPEQDIRAGEVRLRVVEARVRRVKVDGNKFFNEKNVRAGLPSLKEGSTPNTRALSKDAQLVNENPSKQVTVALQAADDPGQVDATVRVTDEKPSRISAYVDNTGTPNTGNWRLGLGYLNSNLFNGDDVLNVQAITSPSHPSDVKIFGAGYRIPIYRWSGIVDVLAGYSSVNSGTVQGLFNVSGSGDVFGLRYTQLLGRYDTYEHRASIGLDYRAYNNDVTFADTGTPLVPDITVRPIALAYLGRFSSVGRDLSFNVSYARNIPGGPHGSDEDFFAQRNDGVTGATSKYSVVREGVAFSQLLPADFIVRALANAQQSHDLLVPGEQFGMGGMDSVRGYYEREVANDNGWRASLEAYSPDLAARFGGSWRARALIFADAARGHDNSPARDPTHPDSKLGSFGIGARANMGKSLAFRLDVARVTQDAGTRVSGDWRAHFAAAFSF